MKNLTLMIVGYLLISTIVNIRVVEKTNPCDAFCPQTIAK